MVRLEISRYKHGSFNGVRNKDFNLITREDKFVITLTLQRYVLNFHNVYFLHTILDRTEVTTFQNSYWPILIKQFKPVIFCDTCKCTKISNEIR